jgi:UDP-N-acetylglucosamine--N-acetylmuramyl-(pentapeptide) pyrophosphoryl-undecaprenol N-acetylglucosamine transferase
MGAVSEIAASGRPSILVPLPTASDQHQLHNAEALQKAGAALLVPDEELSGARLVAEVIRLVDHPARLEAMGNAARAFARAGAARRAAEILESLAAGRASGRD